MHEIIFWGNSRNSNKVSLQQKRILRTVLGINPLKYEGYPESNLRFGIKKTQVKGNIFYYIHLKATILNYFST
jgi:hypothetical protein